MIRRSRLHTAAAPLAFSANPTVVMTALRGHLDVVEDNFYLKENSMVYVGEARVAQLTARASYRSSSSLFSSASAA